MKFLTSLARHIFAGSPKVQARKDQAETLEILNAITAEMFPSHAWMPHYNGQTRKGEPHYLMVSKAEASIQRSYGNYSEIPEPVFAVLYTAFVKGGVPEAFRMPYAPKTKMRISTQSVFNPKCRRARLDHIDLNFLRANRDKLKALVERAGLVYSMGAGYPERRPVKTYAL